MIDRRRNDIYAWIIALLIAAPFAAIGGAALYYRISGDISICKIFYKEMGLAECYFSSKTVRTPQK